MAHTENAQPNANSSYDLSLMEQMLKIIVEVAKPERVILFGSRARGTARDDSDYDFLIIDAKPFDKNRSRLQKISKVSRALAPLRVSTDLLLNSTDEVNYWSQSLNHVIGRAVREGNVLYERQFLNIVS